MMENFSAPASRSSRSGIPIALLILAIFLCAYPLMRYLHRVIFEGGSWRDGWQGAVLGFVGMWAANSLAQYDWPETTAAWNRLKRAWREYRIAGRELAATKARVAQAMSAGTAETEGLGAKPASAVGSVASDAPDLHECVRKEGVR